VKQYVTVEDFVDISLINLWKFGGSTTPKQVSHGEAGCKSGVGLTPGIQNVITQRRSRENSRRDA
jgi:hypothetical protein